MRVPQLPDSLKERGISGAVTFEYSGWQSLLYFLPTCLQARYIARALRHEYRHAGLPTAGKPIILPNGAVYLVEARALTRVQ